MQLVLSNQVSNSAINTLREITRVFMHMSTVNYLLRGAGFFRELHTKAMQS